MVVGMKEEKEREREEEWKQGKKESLKTPRVPKTLVAMKHTNIVRPLKMTI